jgi:hypothetical protein
MAWRTQEDKNKEVDIEKKKDHWTKKRQTNILLRDWVTIDVVWIGNSIYWTLTYRNYK